MRNIFSIFYIFGFYGTGYLWRSSFKSWMYEENVGHQSYFLTSSCFFALNLPPSFIELNQNLINTGTWYRSCTCF
jgi:hypothetical protein